MSSLILKARKNKETTNTSSHLIRYNMNAKNHFRSNVHPTNEEKSEKNVPVLTTSSMEEKILEKTNNSKNRQTTSI